MQLIEYPLRSAWPTFITRPVQDLKAIKKVIKPILKKVERNGDRAARDRLGELIGIGLLWNALERVDREPNENPAE